MIRRLWLVSLLLLLAGCGVVRIPRVDNSAPDFAIAVTPTASTVVAGTAAPAESFVLTRVNGFTGAVTVTGAAPDGITCAPAACSVVIAGNAAANALQFAVPAGTAAGQVTVQFTATSGSLSHVVTTKLLITASGSAPMPPPVSTPPPGTTPPPTVANACAAPLPQKQPANSASGFVATGSPANPTVVFDALHNQILATDFPRNGIDVLSPETMTVVARLPLPQPMGLSLSADGASVVVGTRTHSFYVVSTANLCVTGREYLAPSVVPYANLSPMLPAALADGSILFVAQDAESTASSVVRWIPGTGFVQPAGLSSLAYSARVVVPSGDREHAYVAGADSNGYYGRFDVSSGAFTTQEVAYGSEPNVLAVNQDGSRVLIKNSCCLLEILDGNFSVVASQNGLMDVAAYASPDFSHFYATASEQNFVSVLDATLQAVNIVPFSLAQDFGDVAFAGADAMQRLMLTTPLGLFLVNTGTTQPAPAGSTQLPAVRVGPTGNGAMVPDTPEDGLSTTLNGAGFTASPAISFLEGASAVAVPGAMTTSVNTISLAAPTLSGGCHDVEAVFATGAVIIAPVAYCYAPAVDVVDGDAGPTTGGATLRLYGRGFGSRPTVSVGGAQATNVTVTDQYGLAAPYDTAEVTVVVPPGVLGAADVVVSSATGSLALKGAYTYAQRDDVALPAGAQPGQMIFDAARQRVLVTDAAHNQLLVYGPGSAGLQQSIATGPGPQALALTPDGARLLLTTLGDRKVSVLDAGSFATLQQYVVPTSGPGSLGVAAPLGPPNEVVATASNLAMFKTEAGYLQGPAGPFSEARVGTFDMGANGRLSYPAAPGFNPGGEDFSLTASADGAWVLFANQLLQVATGTYATPDLTTGTIGDVALSSDGSVAAIDAVMLNSQAEWQTMLSAPAPIASGVFTESFFGGMQFNASGSLLYRAAADHVRVYDTAHGILARTVEVPGGGVTGSYTQRLLAVDPAGQRMFVGTAAGISTFTFASDPLTVNRAVVTGAQLAIAGSGFQAGATLAIDLEPIACRVASSLSLTAALPALAAGVHSVTVTNPDGHSYTLTLAFRLP
ncbi:hypothetical protein [Acidipila sp. EB88]|uniref:hypothetical protein n=1 Tax=Acidipila sp. EB88 TaxID=2305226 RepID=UPI000F5EC3A4|nr:hypothetical protein [Acidipila sp. EB88]